MYHSSTNPIAKQHRIWSQLENCLEGIEKLMKFTRSAAVELPSLNNILYIRIVTHAEIMVTHDLLTSLSLGRNCPVYDWIILKNNILAYFNYVVHFRFEVGMLIFI